MRSSRTEDASSEDGEVAALAEENEVLPEPLVYAAYHDRRDEQRQLPGDGAPPLSNFAPPTSDGTPLVSNVAPPTSDSTPPVSNIAPPTGDGASPVSNGPLPIGYCAPPLNNGAHPTDECASPVSNGALPTATESGDPRCESVRLLREFEQMVLDSRLHSTVTIRTLCIVLYCSS